MTLIETLIGALIFAFVISGVYMMYTTMQNTLNRGELMSDLQQNVRIGLAQMTQEIRMTGYDPSGIIPLISSTTPPKAAIRAAMPGCFSFVADVKGSGTASQVTYYLNGTTLYRRFDVWDGGGGFKNNPQPLAGSVVSLSFTYYDANNLALTPAPPLSTRQCPPATSPGTPILQLTFDQMRLIRRVAIILKAQGSRPGVFPQFFTLTNDVRLRNL
jgi:hypothetical protein